MDLKIPDYVYQGLLAEAKRRGTNVPRLAREVLANAAYLFDNGETLPRLGEHGDKNETISQAISK